MSDAKTPKTVYRKDYAPPAYLIKHTDLHFTLDEENTLVKTKLSIYRNTHTMPNTPLILHGVELKLVSITLNDQAIEHFKDDEKLEIKHVPQEFTLEIVTQIKPQLNTSLEGLYKVKQLFCTQCEAESFRKITYYLDRPDVMATFTTTIVADKQRYPVLLSNGNLINQGELPEGKHWAQWSDPFKKPCYLFALVAGDLACIEDSYKTQSGRNVTLRIYVDKGDEDKCAFAMQSIKNAMRWDEETYGREYDLDIFMLVATHDFNMGAMENKGLNIFNAKYVLAKPETATDDDYMDIERVIGHEYFHNWTGNRITCRDWFQLSLKEGLTVFRDSQFGADMTSVPVVRIDDVNTLRSVQFPQDAGPMAHPVRPDSYMEINNFYTVTVYEKGAEVIRMLKTMLGKSGFRKGMDLYFERHDGQAVRIEEFVQAMADANNKDLTQFLRWYDQAGTPEVTVQTRYDDKQTQYTLEVSQACPLTPEQAHKLPFHFPFAIALLDKKGKPLYADILNIQDTHQTFTFNDIKEKPVPSLLRDFSAPVKVHYHYTDEELSFLLAKDNDPFARWDAGQHLGVRAIQYVIQQIKDKHPITVTPLLIEAWKAILQDKTLDPAHADQLLSLPTETYLIELFTPIDIDTLIHARRIVRQTLVSALKDLCLERYTELNTKAAYRYSSIEVGKRSLKNRCLTYLTLLDSKEDQARALQQLAEANNMTDAIAALTAISHSTSPEREQVVEAFYQKWQNETLVVDKWLGIQARSELPNTLAKVKALMEHPAFNIKNPNKVRSLIGAFTANTANFHSKEGAGYQFLSEQIIKLNKINPMIGARLVEPFTRWRKYDSDRQQLIKTELKRIKDIPELAIDIYEVVVKSLENS